jgi:hypothetical protein
VIYEERADGVHLIVHDVAGTTALDLGLAEPDLPVSGGGLAQLSPDDSEVLTARGAVLVAVRLDGTGERQILDRVPTRAGFTGTGDVLYEIVRNLSQSDVADLRYDQYLAHGGGRTAILEDQEDCDTSWTAPSGRYLARTCANGTSVFRLPDGALMRRSTSLYGHVLGFDRDEGGIVVAEFRDNLTDYSLHFITHSGVDVLLGEAWYGDTPTGNAEWPPFHFLP